MRKYLSNILKLLVTILALWLVLREVDLQEIWTTILSADLWWIFAGFMLFNLSMIVRAWRWWVLLRGLGIAPKFSRLVELYFVGNFFNMALPSGFGGDVVRVIEVARDVPTDVATGTVLLDRLAGLIMLFVVAMVMLPFQTAVIPPHILWMTIAGFVGGIVGILLLMDGRLIRRLGGWLPKPLNPNENGAVGKLLQAVQGCGWKSVLQAMAISIIFHFILAGWWFTSGLAFEQSISYSYHLFIMPLVAVPLLIPSFAGFGPRELIVPTLYTVVGVPQEIGLGMSVIVFVITRLSGLVGLPLYLLSLLRSTIEKRNEEESAESAL